MRHVVSFASGLFVLGTFSLVHCSSDYGAEDTHADAGGDEVNPSKPLNDASDSDVVALDPCGSNPNDPKCVSDTSAFFVSASTGDDGNAGTRDKPVKSIGAGLAKLTATKSRLYICDGKYEESVSLTSAHKGVSLFGGVTCDWAPSPTQPTITSSAFGPTLKIDGASGVLIANLAFTAGDAPTPATSTIAAFVHGGDVTFNHVSLTAGKASKGTSRIVAPYIFPADLNGNSGGITGGGLAKIVLCPGGLSTTGGKGGASGFDGESGLPTPPDNRGTVAGCAAGGTGGNGQRGNPGVTPASIAVLGNLLPLPDGFQPSGGADGLSGAPGQGGGGGAGAGGGGGGGGGAGGCGGAGGGGGTGGGASIALAVVDASIHVTASTFKTSEAGTGGDGVAGQGGQPTGGAKGTGVATGCDGGNGGNGGDGSAGGGGAGGISVGVVYKGIAPVLDSATTTAIQTGAKGTAGRGPGPAGIDGVSTPTLEIK